MEILGHGIFRLTDLRADNLPMTLARLQDFPTTISRFYDWISRLAGDLFTFGPAIRPDDTYDSTTQLSRT